MAWQTLRRGCESNILTIIITIPGTLYRRCSHINSSLPGKCSPCSQDRLQYSGVEGYFRREKSNTKYILVRIRRTWYMFSSHPIYYLRPSFLFLLVVTQIRGHITGSFPPFPLRFVRYIFIARRFPLSFLPSSTSRKSVSVSVRVL